MANQSLPQEPAHPDHARETDSIYSRAGVVTFFTLLSRILGLARDLVISHKFGAGAASDAWVQAFRIPNALRRLTAEGAMTIAFVPVYVEVKEKEGLAAAQAFSRRVLGIVLTITLLLCAGGMVFSDGLTQLFSPGFAADPEKFQLTSNLIRWSFPYLVLVSLVAWAMGLLNSEHYFAAPAAAPIFLNLGIIVAVVWFASRFSQPILAVAFGVLAGGVAQVALQLPSLRKTGVRPLPLGGWRHPHMKKLMGLLVPSLVGVAVYQVNIILLGIIASFLPTGQIFHYNNATRMTELVLGLFAFSFTTAGLPTLSRHQANQDWPRMAQTLRLTFSAVMFMILPAMAGLTAAGLPIVAMLYLHGQYHYADVVRTANTLIFMVLGMPAVALVRVMVPAYFAIGDARTPVKVAGATLLVTAGASWFLSRSMEVEGLALGLSLGVWFQCLGLALVLRKKTDRLKHWFPWDSIIRQGVSALVVGALAYGLSQFGDWSLGGGSIWNWGILIFLVLASIGVYLGLNLILGEPEAANWVKLAGRAKGKLTRHHHP